MIDIKNHIENTKPKENSGSTASNRFDFQKNWAICKILELHQKPEDYLLTLEYYDDVIVFDSSDDPKNDTLARLKDYMVNLGINGEKWFFVTGKQEKILEIAEKGYFSIAYSDSTEPGGFVHSGGLFLIDKKRHIRGFYDGTNDAEVDKLIKDIVLLKSEQKTNAENHK